jgi:hypothetical protein
MPASRTALPSTPRHIRPRRKRAGVKKRARENIGFSKGALTAAALKTFAAADFSAVAEAA